MGIIMKRNGSILTRLGIATTIISLLIGIFFPNLLFTKVEEEYVYTPLANIVYSCWIIGPILVVVGIPIYIVGAKRVQSRMMEILKSNIYARFKISFLAGKIGINEKDVESTIYKLRSNGEPVLIDHSTGEVIYNPTLSTPSTKIKKPSLTLHEKLEVIISIISIFISILLALLK